MDWIKHRLVDDWRSSWRWLSVQLAAVAAFVCGLLLAYPETILTTLNLLPPEARGLVPPAVSFALFAVVLAARLWKQAHPKK